MVGAYSMAYHGVPRFTGDIDLFVEPSHENAIRLEEVVRAFGFESMGLKKEDFLEPNHIIQLGISPHRIDLLTGIDGVEFAQAWSTKEMTKLDGLPVFMLSKELLIKNKLAVRRDQDLVDVKRLQELSKPSS